LPSFSVLIVLLLIRTALVVMCKTPVKCLKLENTPTVHNPHPGSSLDFQSRYHSILYMPFPIGSPLELSLYL